MRVSASSLNFDIKNASQCLQINQSFYISWRIVKKKSVLFFCFHSPHVHFTAELAFLLLNFIFTHWWASHTSYTIYNTLISYNHARRYWEQYTCVIWVYKTITMSFVLVSILLVKLHLNNRFRQFLICTSRQTLRGLWQDIIANPGFKPTNTLWW